MRLYLGIVTSGNLIACFYVIIAVVATCQLGDFIVVPCNVIAEVPGEVLSHNRFGVDGKFHTVVFQWTDILCHLGIEVSSDGNFNAVQQVIRFTEVSVDTACDSSIQESEVQSGIPCGRFFPFQIFIESLRAGSRVIRIAKRILGILVIDYIQRKISKIITYVLLTGNTPA